MPENTAPTWLHDLAAQIDEWARYEGVRERFTYQIAQFTNDHRRRRPRDGVFTLPPRYTLAMAERYTLVAAIHARCCPGRRQLWAHRKLDRKAANAGLPFFAVMSRLDDLQDEHEDIIHDLVASVADDLRRTAGCPARLRKRRHAEQVHQHIAIGVTINATQAIADQHEQESQPQSTVTWQDAQVKLERLRDQGEAYTSYKDLAHRIGCKSTSTISKAFDKSQKLRNWRDGAKRPGKPRATVLDDMALDRQSQNRESDPSDALPDDEVEVVFARLVDDASPKERAALHCKSMDEKRDLAMLYLEQGQDARSTKAYSMV